MAANDEEPLAPSGVLTGEQVQRFVDMAIDSAAVADRLGLSMVCGRCGKRWNWRSGRPRWHWLICWLRRWRRKEG